MARGHLVRVGTMGQVGRFTSVDAARYGRGERVVLRTDRGLELGEVLAPPDDAFEGGAADGMILRPLTPADELLQARIEQHKQAAFEACSARVRELGLPVMLIDVEHLFDGASLYFYFLGEESPQLAELVDELTETYESRVQFRRFTESVTTGCGPGCGTESASGGGCGSCSLTGCAAAGACGVKRTAGA